MTRVRVDVNARATVLATPVKAGEFAAAVLTASEIVGSTCSAARTTVLKTLRMQTTAECGVYQIEEAAS